MAVAALPLTPYMSMSVSGTSPSRRPHPSRASLPGPPAGPLPLPRKPLPAGQPREWYVAHNRRLKTMRLVIALLDSGIYEPAQAGDRRIRATAELIGVHPPSDITCRMVRALLCYGR